MGLAINIVLTILFVAVLMGLGVTALVVWAAVKVFGVVKRKLMGEAPQKGRLEQPAPTRRATHEAYRHMDVDAGTTSGRIAEVMSEYAQDSVVGSYAQDVIDTLDLADRRRSSLYAEIDGEFERDTISWEKFTATANSALDAVLRNCATLANRVQTFDTNDYRRMQEFYRTGGFQTHGTQDAAKLQRWRLLDETKKEMDSIRSTNQRLLLELGRLSAELSKLSSSDAHDEGESIVEEVSKLVEQTKYYR